MRLGIAMLLAAALPLGMPACAPPAEPPVPPDLAEMDAGARQVVQQAVQAVQASPRNPEVWKRLGQIYLAHQISSEAATALAQFAALGPSPEAHTLHALALDQLGDVQGRRAAIDAAIALGGNHTTTLWRAAMWALERGDVERAAALPGSGDTEATVLAIVRLAQGRPDDAATLMVPIVKRRPRDGHAHWVIGRSLLALGKSDEAESHLLRAGDATPSFDDPWERQAESTRSDFVARIGRLGSLAKSRQFQQARESLHSLRTLYGQRREVDLAEATLTFLEGDHARSAQLLSQLMDRWPAWFPPHVQQAHQLLQRSRSSGGRSLLTSAREAAEAAVAISPGKAEGWSTLGRVALAQNDLDTAAYAFGRAVDAAPERPAVSLQWAESLAVGGEPDEALDVLARHERIFGRSLPCSLLRVQALVGAGRGAQAKTLFDQCLQQAPNIPRVQRMAQLLEKAGL